MRLLWGEQAWTDYHYWQDTDRDMLRRVNELVRDISRDPFRGIGKPEPLKGDLSGWWSRRITGEHRLVYRVVGKDETQCVEIISCRYHY
jgi:toxin YoeB